MTTEATVSPIKGGRDETRSVSRDTKKPGRTTSADHKTALTSGRDESRAVRRYLEALSAAGYQEDEGDPEALAERIQTIDSQLAAVEPAAKVRLIQERMDLYARLKVSREKMQLEQAFVAAAGAYSSRKGISYAAWRRVGVDDAVLQRAGISRQ